MDPKYQFDIFVIGGGSGGLTVVDEAQQLGKRVGLADYVKPSPHGTTWGTGGTCPNVGCIPKKLMHMAALVGEIKHELVSTGWQIDAKAPHKWDVLVNEVQRQVKGINKANDGWLLETNGLTYYNKLGKLKDPHTIELISNDGGVECVTAETIVISVGSRPSFLKNIPNVEKLCITSDDLFSLQKPPGKTLVVGASYVALECGGFLNGLGYDVTVMVRSILLRGFDQEMAERIGEHMKIEGVKFIRGTVPSTIEETQDNRRLVKWIVNGQEQSDVYDTVILAIGRSADTKNIGLESLGINYNKDTWKIVANEADQTNVSNIYAIGDCVEGRLELTPTAIMCGKRLIKRLYCGATQLMGYQDVSTTVFTPLEYGCAGYSEEEAIKRFGKDNLKIFFSEFTPLFWNFAQRKGKCYVKLIVKKDDDVVIGFHYLGPDAAEVTQGFGVVIKLKAKKEDLNNTVGIHPSGAEEIVQLTQWR